MRTAAVRQRTKPSSFVYLSQSQAEFSTGINIALVRTPYTHKRHQQLITTSSLQRKLGSFIRNYLFHALLIVSDKHLSVYESRHVPQSLQCDVLSKLKRTPAMRKSVGHFSFEIQAHTIHHFRLSFNETHYDYHVSIGLASYLCARKYRHTCMGSKNDMQI